MKKEDLKLNKKEGITLIVLVITIVILLILAGVTIASLTSENSVIKQAEEAKFKTELAQLKEELEKYKVEKSLIENFDGTSLSANKLWLYYDPVQYVENGTIKDVMPSISENMIDKIEILNGEIMFSGSEIEIAWAKEIGINKIVKVENGVLLSDNDNLSILSENGTFIVPSLVRIIGEGSFSQIEGIKKIIIPYTVKEIAPNAFYGNKTLEEVEIQTRGNEGLEKIGDSAFYTCTNLKEIILPNTVKSAENQAFNGCSSLNKIILSNNMTEISSYLFGRLFEIANCRNSRGHYKNNYLCISKLYTIKKNKYTSFCIFNFK